jgi:hypothetical protein
MVCQNLELQEDFNFLLRCILETRLTLTNEGLYSPHSQIPRLFPSYTHWFQIHAQLQEY